MYAQVRVWSSLAPAIRSVIVSRSEILHSVKSYGNHPTVPSSSQPWSIICSAQQVQHHSSYLPPLLAAGAIQQKLAVAYKTLNRSIRTTPNRSLDHQHNENEHAHNVLRSLPEYTHTTVAKEEIEMVLPPVDMTNSPPPLPGMNWDAIQPHGIAGSFIALSKECTIRPMDLTSSDHAELCSALAKNVCKLTNNQLQGVLAALTLWPQTDASNSPNFHDIWEALDLETVKRVHLWDLQHSFLVADLWYSLKLSRIGCYTKVMLTSLAKQIEEMKPHELVQFVFHINLIREHPANVSFSMLEKKIAIVIDQLSIEELGVIAMGLFKAQAFIRTDELVDAYFKRLLTSDLSGVSSISMGAIFKVMRKSAQAKRVDKLYKFLDKIQPILSELSLPAQLQVALVGNDTMVFHPKVINYITENFADNASSLRLKDIERIVFVMMLYNFSPPSRPEIFDIFADELRKPERHSEINQYPKAFFSYITYMASMGFFPQDLLSAALEPSFISSLKKSSNYSDIGREIMELDCILDMENLGNYKGNRLDPELKESLLVTYFDKSRLPRDILLQAGSNRSRLTHNEALTLDIEDKLRALLGGQDKVTTAFIFPHVPMPDIVFCTDPAGEPVSLPASFLSYAPRSIKYPILKDPMTGEPLRWTAVIVGGRNSYIRGTSRLRGQVQMKTRHLQSLGYNVTMIPFMDYSKRNFRRKLATLDELLVKSGALAAVPSRASDAYISIKGEESRQQELTS